MLGKVILPRAREVTEAERRGDERQPGEGVTLLGRDSHLPAVLIKSGDGRASQTSA